MSNVISFRANRYAKMEPVEVFFEIINKEDPDAEDQLFLDLAIAQCGFTPEDLEDLAAHAEECAAKLLNPLHTV